MRNRFRTSTALTLALALVLQPIWPVASVFALTSGPAQPDFAHFETVGTGGMVNPLTGQFSYNLPVLNVPGPNGSGYSLSLSYQSGASPEDEASWVGYGWTLSPGAITRNKRGFPDDYDGDKVRYWNRTGSNWTLTAGMSAYLEAFGWQDSSIIPHTFGLSTQISYNNHKGFGYYAGASAVVRGIGSLSLGISDAGVNFSPRINPAELLSAHELANANDVDKSTLVSTEPAGASATIDMAWSTLQGFVGRSFANDVRATNIHPFVGIVVKMSGSILSPFAAPPAGEGLGISGTFAHQVPADGGLAVRDAFGYMYSANAGSDGMMDYYVERDDPYTRRDQFLNIPFSNADYFAVSGQGIGGGFRIYNRKPGQFRPYPVHSSTTTTTVEFQPHAGPLNLGLGFDPAVAYSWMDVRPWISTDGRYAFAGAADGDEPWFFRMNNDRGGGLLYADDDAPVRGTAEPDLFIPGLRGYDVGISEAGMHALNNGRRSGRALHVGYSTNAELINSTVVDEGIYPNFQAHDNEDRSRARYQSALKRIAEFGLTTAEGMKYVYGLPVLARAEKNLQYGLTRDNLLTLRDRYLAYSHQTAPYAEKVVGEERDAAYAASYLLTAIFTPDYIDRGMDGPTSDDFGGYTRFTYTKTAGDDVDYATLNFNPDTVSSGPGTSQVARPRYSRPTDPNDWAKPGGNDANGWYRWRSPYTGLLYHPNSLSDEKDDMGSMAMGEREMHYLRTIETRSHVAVFVTNAGLYTFGRYFPGSGAHRRDGYQASHSEFAVAGDSTEVGTHLADGSQAPNHLRRLERIELWSRNSGGGLSRLIQTVHFEFDSSICLNMPNSYKGPGHAKSAGKLTLKRVYFEYNGVVNARISPYVFGYQYRTGAAGDYNGLPDEVRTKYAAALQFGERFSAAEQNPEYAPQQVDRWGHYEYDGAARRRRMNPWIDQTPDTAAFDPAAWQLKWIRLPSGGEIHIQYEQSDYAFVQDHPAMAMVSLLGADLDQRKYYLDVNESLGLPDNSTPQKGIVEAMRRLFVDGREKIFFRTLHALKGTPDVENVENHRHEMMQGYARVVDAGIETSGPFSGKAFVQLSLGEETQPGDLALNFVNAERGGMIGSEPLRAAGDAESRVRSVVGRIGETFSVAATGGVDWDDSYMRVPLGTPSSIVRNKLGGGIRVLRLLTYDPGIEDGAGHLFGTQYEYRTVEGYSSGVASNEPAEGREESALVRLLDRRAEQNFFEKIIAGNDREQFEGPIGETLLPGPVVLYSRVVERNIHDGISGPGFTVHEYFTTKDYPSECLYGAEDITPERATDILRQDESIDITAPFFSYSKSNVWAVQGFRFRLNDMAGQIKRVATYGGNYSAPQTDWHLSAMEEYSYFAPGEQVPMLYDYTTQPTYRMEDPGKEMEITMEGRSVEDNTIDLALPVDGSIGIVPAVPVPIVIPFTTITGAFGCTEASMRTHVTAKVIRYPAIVKSVTALKDNITSTVENIGFNPLDGQPCVVRTGDGYTGLLTQMGSGGPTSPHNRTHKAFSYPAALEYPEMGQKAANERATIATVPGSVEIDKRYDAGKHYLSFKYPGGLCTAAPGLVPGDLVDVFKTDGPIYDPGGSIGVFNVESVQGNRVILQPRAGGPAPVSWMSGVSVFILRSGRTNQLAVPRAGITVYSQD